MTLPKVPKYLIVLGVVTLSFIVLFVKLALWQFDRSNEKQLILDKIAGVSSATQSHTPPIIKNAAELSSTLEYTKIKLDGHFNNLKTIYLSNQFYDHTSGYHVITPFILADSNDAVLVNRGWVKAPSDFAAKFPDNSAQNITLVGVVKDSSNQYIMGSNFSKQASFLQIQRLDLAEIKQLKLFDYNLADKYLKLISPSEQGFVLDWQWTNMPPEKHYAYAIQWLLLAITVILLYSCLCYKTLCKR